MASINDTSLETSQEQLPNSFGAGQLPPTVSAPGSHYTTTIDARALIAPDTTIFFAYNKTYEKRILNVLRLSDGLSLYKQRPLYLEDSPHSQGTTSIFELLCDKFGDEPAKLYILRPPGGFSTSWSEPDELNNLGKDLCSLSARLPVIPLDVEGWVIPAYRPHNPPNLPRMFELTAHPENDARNCPVVLGDAWLKAFL